MARRLMYPLRKYFVLFGLLASMQLCIWTASGQDSTKVTSAVSVPKAASVHVGQTVGISSCSGGGCHGSAIPKGTPALSVPPSEAWRSAYTHWLSYDNHAKAYNVLREERARKMMVRLSDQREMSINAKGEESDASAEKVEQIMTFSVRVRDAKGRITSRRATMKENQAWKVVLETGESPEGLTIVAPERYHPDATQESRCLACHVNPSLAFTPSDPLARENVESHRRQGVGCEACHGNGSSWRDSHVKWPDGPDKKRFYEEAGMIWLNDPVSRARACAGCHVGAPPSERSPEVRNMNHDMIAAGHPRLNFEYSNYQMLETPHWIEKDRTKSDENEKRVPLDATFHGRNWLIGRAVQLEQALALLEYRTRTAPAEATDFENLEKDALLTRNSKTTHRLDPWPELSEFNCYACHQSFRPEFYPPTQNEAEKPTERKFPFSKKAAPKEPPPSDLVRYLRPPLRPLGSWVWDPLFGTARVFGTTEKRELTAIEALLKLQEAIHLKKPDQAKIHKLAETALGEWEKVTNSLLVPRTLQLDKRRELLFEVAKPARWDELAQTYLGLRSLNGNQGDPAIEEKLYFPYRSESNRQDSPQSYASHGSDGAIPASFDPKQAAEEFLKDLQKWKIPNKDSR